MTDPRSSRTGSKRSLAFYFGSLHTFKISGTSGKLTCQTGQDVSKAMDEMKIHDSSTSKPLPYQQTQVSTSLASESQTPYDHELDSGIPLIHPPSNNPNISSTGISTSYTQYSDNLQAMRPTRFVCTDITDAFKSQVRSNYEMLYNHF
jgi:hypothetical protein